MEYIQLALCHFGCLTFGLKVTSTQKLAGTFYIPCTESFGYLRAKIQNFIWKDTVRKILKKRNSRLANAFIYSTEMTKKELLIALPSLTFSLDIFGSN